MTTTTTLSARAPSTTPRRCSSPRRYSGTCPPWVSAAARTRSTWRWRSGLCSGSSLSQKRRRRASLAREPGKKNRTTDLVLASSLSGCVREYAANLLGFGTVYPSAQVIREKARLCMLDEILPYEGAGGPMARMLWDRAAEKARGATNH